MAYYLVKELSSKDEAAQYVNVLATPNSLNALKHIKGLAAYMYYSNMSNAEIMSVICNQLTVYDLSKRDDLDYYLNGILVAAIEIFEPDFCTTLFQMYWFWRESGIVLYGHNEDFLRVLMDICIKCSIGTEEIHDRLHSTCMEVIRLWHENVTHQYGHHGRDHQEPFRIY